MWSGRPRCRWSRNNAPHTMSGDALVMMDRQKGKFVFECDGPGCSEVLETGESNFQLARDALANEDWRTQKSQRADEWNHFCPNCQKTRR